MNTNRHSLWFHTLDVLLNIVIILAIVAVVRTFLVSPFQVEGNSMLSTLENKEYIIINKLAYHMGEPDRGDVVVFRPPNDESRHYVKRIIGVPGDIVVIRDGRVYVQRPEDETPQELDETYLDEHNAGRTYRHPPSSGDTREERYEVPDDHFFLLGDNRQGSLDSRSFAQSGNNATPYVPEANIKGKVWLVALPITKIHALEPPQYAF